MKHKHYAIALLITILSFHFGKAQTTVKAVIDSNQTWTPAGNPYILKSNAVVMAGVKLTIKPGTKVRATGNFKIVVNGQLNAQGTKDSVIVFDTATFEFSKTSGGHNFKNGTGSQFNYCYFNGNSFGSIYTINVSGVSMLIRNSKFYNCYYCVYCISSSTDTNILRLEKTKFLGGTYGGYAAYISGGKNTFLEMDECLVKDMYGFLPANHNKITRNTFYNWLGNSGLRINTYNPSYNGKSIISCNTFKKFPAAVLEITGAPVSSMVTINNNTFDSAETFISISLMSTTSTKYTTYVQNNNFLTFKKNSVKVGGGNSSGIADTIDFSNNYWGTTSTSAIEAGIHDYKDDPTTAGIIHFGGALSSQVTDCFIAQPGSNQLATQNMKSTGFHIFPNPTKDILNIQTTHVGNHKLQLTSLTGQVLMSTDFHADKFTLDCSNIQAGIYFVFVQEDGMKSAVQKVLIQK
jgi:Secretion system C-terminal sorting domain